MHMKIKNIFLNILIVLSSIAALFIFATVQFYIIGMKEISLHHYIVPFLVGIIVSLVLLKLKNLMSSLKEKEEHNKKLAEKLKNEVDMKTKQVEDTQKLVMTIFNIQKNMVVITNGDDLKMVNEAFFQYFPQYKSLQEFKKEHKCICEFFKEKEGYISPVVDGKNWLQYVEENPDKIHKAVLEINGKEFIMEIKLTPFNMDGEKLYVIVFNDITELEKFNEKLYYQVYFDELTGLPNRKKLIEDIQKYEINSLCLVNIDDFKSINDTYGIETGDLLLKEVGQRLNKFIKENGTNKIVYRLPADEFAILELKKESKQFKITKFEELVSDLVKKLTKEPYKIQDYEIYISVSIGIALVDYSINKRNLLPDADIALKTAKRKRKHYYFFAPDLKTKKNFEENIYWTKKLREAIQENRITTFYQPILNLRTMKIEKYECLVRMIDEQGNVISPYKFLEISKASKLYPEITKKVFIDSVRTFRDTDKNFSINIDVEDITNKDILSIFKLYINKYNIGTKITFEFLENESIENYEIVKDFIEEFKEYGCKFAIDDFGSGYSNFERLLEMNIDCIKIDGSFIKKITYDKSSELIVNIIKDFAHSVGMKTVAEFVSNEEIYKKVKEMGFDMAQGFYIARPQPVIGDLNEELKNVVNL